MKTTATTLLVLALCAAGRAEDAGRKEPLPDEFQGVELVEHRNAQLPLDLEFLDETGTKVALGSYFGQGRPVVMALVYFECPMLCTPLLNGMIDAMKAMPPLPGKDYECVIVSFDPLEGPALAAKKKASLLEAYERPGTGGGIHLLTGEKANIAKLAAAIGFGYRWVEKQHMYAHPAAIYVCTPTGKLSRYLKGVVFDSKTLRESLKAAGEEQVGPPSDEVTQTCSHVDSTKSQVPLRLMRIAGGVIVVAIILTLLILRSKRRQTAAEAQRK